MTNEQFQALKDLVEKYVAEDFAAARNSLLKPGLYVSIVYHDDWCDKIAGKGPCNCNPEIEPPERI